MIIVDITMMTGSILVFMIEMDTFLTISTLNITQDIDIEIEYISKESFHLIITTTEDIDTIVIMIGIEYTAIESLMR